MSKDINHEVERKNDSNRILDSIYSKKVVVAGPGTGKSFLFQEAIKRKKKDGKKNFLAITFIGKLCDELADDLAGLAQTMTLHGFAREFLLDKCPKGWEYYPRMYNLIRDDLAIKGISDFEIGDENYENRTKHYRAVGDDDVVHYAVEICKKDLNKIPTYDLILIDEFQDFNEKEAEFIDLLASKNEILIVGDDDQALYEFKGSFSKFIRSKYDKANTDFESHTLKYCSRCTQVIIDAFHGVVSFYKNKGLLNNRIDDKKYICYTPDKSGDSLLNPKILLVENIVPGAVPMKIRSELFNISHEQKIKSVLVIGEGRTCKKTLETIAKRLREFGFKDVKNSNNYHKAFTFNQGIIAGYKILNKGENDIFAWRIIIEKTSDQKKKEIISDNYDNVEDFINAIPKKFKDTHIKTANTLKGILEKTESGRKQIANSSIEKLQKELVVEEKEKRDIFIGQLIDENIHVPRPLANLDITVCSILGSKGLGADIVFLVGFDQGKIPIKNDAEDSEVYQLLVALTRAKKRIYLFNTTGKQISSFSESMENFIEKI